MAKKDRTTALFPFLRGEGGVGGGGVGRERWVEEDLKGGNHP